MAESEPARKGAHWRAEILDHGLSAVIYEDTEIDGCSVHIARLDGTPGYPVVKHARLIAEAPAMKAVLKRMMHPSEHGVVARPDDIAEANAILARIDGEGWE